MSDIDLREIAQVIIASDLNPVCKHCKALFSEHRQDTLHCADGKFHFWRDDSYNIHLLTIARAYLELESRLATLTAPLEVVCPDCQGTGQFDAIVDNIKCDTCAGRKTIPCLLIEAARKAFEDAPHDVFCKIRVLGVCDCPRAALGIAIEALIARLSAAEARERKLREALQTILMFDKCPVSDPDCGCVQCIARAALAASSET